MKGNYRIGTSNIVVPGSKQTFPPEFQNRSRLHYYSTLFNSVEINRSFYKTPLPATFERWSNEVTADFQFTVKISKGITHNKNLEFREEDVKQFMVAANRLNNKKGCLLVQFPASITIDYAATVQSILETIKSSDPTNSWPIAVEFRHMSWYQPPIYQLLDGIGATLVLHDIPRSKITSLQTRAPFVFIRYHGILGDYKGSYSKAHLTREARKIRTWLSEGKDVYAYFNNTIGDAFENARSLSRFLTKP
jgi:uncharacterized protein YecE (DUF72 family)